jgi:uncharacterized protein DUF4328
MAFPEHQARMPAGLTASEPFVSAHTRAMVVVALFVAYIVVTISAIAANIMQVTLPTMVIAAAEGDQEQFTLADLIQFLVALATLFVFISLVIAFLVWLHRSVKNLPALGTPKSKVEHTPGWAVGFFFIPVAHLFLPYRVLKETWAKSDPSVSTEDGFMMAPPSTTPSLLVGWEITWVAWNVLSNISWRLESRASGMQGVIVVIDIISDLFGIICAVFAITVVRGIDRRQTERARLVTYSPNIPPPPPIFRPPYAGAPGGTHTPPANQS